MRKLKLFFACLLMAVLSIGQVWGAVGDTYTQITGKLSEGTHEVLIAVGDYNTSNSATSGSSYIASDKTNGTQITLSAVTFGGSAGAYTYVCTDAKQIYTIVVDANGDITSAKSSDNTNFSPSTSSNKLVTTASGMDVEVNGDYYKWSKTSGTTTYHVCSQYSYNLRAYKNKCGNTKYCCNLILLEVTPSTDKCATPTFSLAAGAVLSGTTVSISCATDGATIHYTTNGNTPTTSSPTYSTPIAINSNTTIKAIAVKSGISNSAEATASYTIATPYTTIVGLAEDMTASDQSVYVTFGGWQVSVVKGSQAFVTDGTNGLIIYQSGHGLKEGDVLTGTVQCTLVSYNGVVELKGITKTMDGITVTGGTISPVVKTIAEANALGVLNTGILIKLENVTYTGTTFEDASSNTIAPYTSFYDYSSVLTSGKKYNVVGIVQQYQSNSQIYPRKAADIEEVTEEGAPEAPTFSPAAGEYDAIQTVELSCATDGATIYYTTNGDTPDNTSTEYSSAITVDETMTIKAIAIKNEKSSSVATAAYTINLPVSEEDQKTWDLTIDETATASADELTWTATYVDMSFTAGSSTAANNYYPGTSGKSYTSTRAYSGATITITPNGKQITSIVFTTTTTGYATALNNATWTNGTPSKDNMTVTVTVSNAGAVSCALTANTGLSSVQVNYGPIDTSIPEAPTFSPAAGEYDAIQTVELSCATDGATIYYTTNGDTPDNTSTEYSSAITVDETMTIKAIAIKNEKSSSVATAAYTINLPVSEEDQKTWDLTIDETATASADKLTWTATYVDMSVTSGTAAANNYYPGKNPSYTETRFYNGATLTITPNGKQITSIVIAAGNATPFKNASWTNGVAAASGNTVTVTVSTPGAVSAVLQANAVAYSVQVNYGPIDTSIPEAPTFSPAAGTYTSAQSVELACATEGATIYYTTDGTTPTSESTEYTAAISVEEDMTIKAIAIKDEKVSPVATAAYVINLPLSTIQAVYDKAVEVGSTATEVNIAFNNWVVSGISTDNKNVYVTDGTKGFVIYDSEADHGFAVNDKLNGTVATSLKLYNKYADVIGLKANAEGLTVTHDGVITPVAATIADLGAVNTGAPIILNGVMFDGSVLSDGVNSITPYITFYADAVISLESDKYYNITGIYVHFNNTKEIAPRSAADIVESVLVDPEISYDPASDEITKGEEGSWSAPTLINEHGVTIASYASDNEEVATVTDGGVISLAGGIGIAVITAHSNATSTYAAGNATYTITVNAPAPTPSGTTYRKVTATADITDGEYLIVYETTSVAFDGSLETLDAVDNTVDVTINEGEIAGTAAIDAAVFTIDVKAGSIKSASNKYIGVSSYSNGLSVSDDADAFENALSIDADGNAVIVITTTGGDMTLRYNSASNQLRFRYYKSGQQAIQLYKKVVVEPDYGSYQRDVTNGNYGTICLPKAGTIEGATLFEIAYYDETAKKIYLDEVTDGAMVAGRPYIFQATATELNVAYTSGDVVATAGNYHGLYGFYDLNDENATTGNLPQDAGNYILYQNAYWLVKDRDAYVANYRAYIKLGVEGGAPTSAQAQAPGRRRVAMTVHGEQVATGIDAINASEKPMKIMIDGQIFILRGEKMYDATGRLVK